MRSKYIEYEFRHTSDGFPKKGERYLVMDADGVVNVATWSGENWVGWDIIDNSPLIGIEYYADTNEFYTNGGETECSDF